MILNSYSGKVRRYYRNGKEYFSAPMTLIVPGVLSGSKGPGYYSPEEVAKTPEIWNNIPIVVYHPTRNGNAVSASDPDILPKHIGKLTQAVYRGKLIAIGEFDGEATKREDPRVYEALNKGVPMELSTGLYTDSIPAPTGSKDYRTGKAYSWVAKGFKPDHLAILPDQNGACSIKDGCGMLVNTFCPTGKGGGWKNGDSSSNKLVVKSEEKFNDLMTVSKTGSHKGKKVDDLRDFGEDKFDDAGDPLPRSRTRNSSEVSNQSSDKDRNMEDRAKNVDYLTTNCSCMKKENGKDILNLLDDDQVKDLRNAVENNLVLKSLIDNAMKGFRELYPDSPSTLNEMPAFIKKKKGAKEVPEEEEEEETEDEEVENKGKKKCTTNSNKRNSDMTIQEWLATAPPEAKAIWNSAVEVEKGERNRLADLLTSNSSSPEAAKEVYLTMDISKLRALESAMPKKAVANTKDSTDETPSFYFPGAVGGATTTNAEDAEPDVLPLPTINWSDLAKAK